MSIATTYSAQLVGLAIEIISVEVDISNGLHAFSIVGLGDRSVDEAKDRISAAIKNSGFTSPKQRNHKVVISLAPADLRKEGPSFDLAMAIAYLTATGDVQAPERNALLFGELSLEGNIRKTSGLLPLLCQAHRHGFTTAFVPTDNIAEASLAQNMTIYAASRLDEIIGHLSGDKPLCPIGPATLSPTLDYAHTTDMQTVRGNETAKRSLEIAAAGAHNIIMSGPPGTGKTMLAHAFHSILPPLSYEQAVEVTGIHSAARSLTEHIITHPPFRAPHHTASYPSVIGGGAIPKPGEITLAHRGVLFLDEFTEFDRDVIEALRQPLEDHSVTISRARGTVTFPAQCIFVASMNPCPCGKGIENGCVCPRREIDKYRRKISGPILDRIDIWMNVHKVDYDELSATTPTGESSKDIRARIIVARLRQEQRFKKYGLTKYYNSEMNARDIDLCVTLDENARETLKLSAQKFELSGRGYHRIIKVAQTIADLAGTDTIRKEHILEALQYKKV
ncbi:MAG: YifB family Mg chelatase-like AAA ATPase [Patescibacteria group bacterium]